MEILRLVTLVLGTVVTIFYLLMIIKSGQYEAMTQNLENFENKDLCSIGFAMEQCPPFALRGKLGNKLYKEAELLYGSTYKEYYARLHYARALSLTVLLLAIALLLPGLLGGGDLGTLILVGGIIAAGAVFISELQSMEKLVTQRREACLEEFPNVISKLALLVSSGMILFEAWTEVARSKEGQIYDLMRSACEQVSNGMAETDAYYQFGMLSDSTEIRKFSSMLIQSLEKGGEELTGFLMKQSSEMWSQKRQRSLQTGDAAAAKLLIPTTLMLAGVMLIILSVVLMSMSGSL